MTSGLLNQGGASEYIIEILKYFSQLFVPKQSSEVLNLHSHKFNII